MTRAPVSLFVETATAATLRLIVGVGDTRVTPCTPQRFIPSKMDQRNEPPHDPHNYRARAVKTVQRLILAATSPGPPKCLPFREGCGGGPKTRPRGGRNGTG
jgi:hypothetical protein